MNYVRLSPKSGRNEARCELIHNYFSSYKLQEGIPLTAEFPADAEFHMSDDFPNATALVDVLFVLESMLVVGTRARALLEERAAADLEFLPVTVKNHKDRKVKESYFVVNVLRIVDCIDKGRTVWQPNPLDPDSIDEVKNLTIDEARIDPGVTIFRPKGLEPLIVARRDLAEHLRAAGVKGLGVSELADYES